MRARVVIGANFGDEGKGLMTDYLCAHEGAGAVVRFNGGAQAGHTVVTPDGRRHVFQHVGSGTFAGVPTFLSQFFVCNPLMFFREVDELRKVGVVPVVFAHPSCLVTTFADMMINQRIEDKRGAGRHGSVGLGFSETINRSELPQLKITMADLWNFNRPRLQAQLAEICGKYSKFRTGQAIDKPEAMITQFLHGCEMFAAAVHPAGIAQCKDPVFEGAQGLLLDQDNKIFFPHVTRSSTGMKNVRILCAQAGIKGIDPYYVSRTYLTRHGAGPLPGHNPGMSFEDKTNVPHPYQGAVRFAPLDSGLRARCAADADGPFRLVLTHCDQLAPVTGADLRSHGETRDHIEKESK
ncbi:Adenylosuccinate synthetase [compost metagenome]